VRILALLLAFTQAPTDPGEGEPISGPIAVHWRIDEPDEALATSLREHLAQLDGRPTAAVRDRAVARARVAVSRERPEAIRAIHGELRALLDGADAAFREGRFDEAEQSIASVLSGLAGHPELVGAAAMAREAWLLAAAIAWAAGDRDRAEQALSAALVLDPEALLSTRRAPPELVARYRAIQTELLDERETTWIEPTITEAEGVAMEIEIDGVPGLRRVPPGEHFVVVQREGHEPVAQLLAVDEAWTVEAGHERIAEVDPDHADQAEALCETLELDMLVLAERRDSRIGLQAHRCGAGFGPRWIGERERLATGVAAIVVGPFDAEQSSLAGPWPSSRIVDTPESPLTDDPTPPKPWYRKGWIWGTSVGVAAVIGGAIATGVVLSSSPGRRGLVVDADDFIGF
jgi:hypothetical protein